MLARVALIEDNDELRDDVLAPGLVAYGFDVAGFGTAHAFNTSEKRREFDLVIVDISLPDESGLKVIQRIRMDGITSGIVALSAWSIERAGTTAFQLGGDLYLTKPVTVDLLASALHAVLRRTWSRPKAAGPGAVAGDQSAWYVTGRDGELIPLTAVERMILGRLRQSSGQPVDRENLIRLIAQDAFDFDPHRLEVLIHRLRKKLTLAVTDRAEIVTVRGAGYALVPGR